MTIPKHLLITSGSNELEFVKTIPQNKVQKETMYVYKYSKVGSLSNKLGTEISFNEFELKKHLSNYFKEI